MITIIIAAGIAVTVAMLVLIRSRRAIDPDQLVERRSPPLMMGVQIICGNCAGDAYRSNRTYLDLTGHCAQCGGSSYVLASVVGTNQALARAERVRRARGKPSHGRIIPFDASGSRGSRGSRTRKIAV